MNARRTPCRITQCTMSAPLCAPRSAVWITFRWRRSQTATSPPRQLGSMPPAHSAGGPKGRTDAAVRLGQRFEVVHVVRTELAATSDRPRTEVPDEGTRPVVDLDDAPRACGL